MEVTKLSSDKSEILVQLYDSLEDVLEKGNELDKKILEQMEAFNRVEKELSNLDMKFDSLKSNNVDNLTTNGAKDAGDIVRKIISKKKEKQNLLDTDQVLYKEYMIITNEIKKIQDDIDNILNEEEIETLSTNQGMKVNSLDTIVHIRHTDLSYIVLESISVENSEISVTNENIVNEISRKFKLNEEEKKESNNPHEMLMNLYNSRNRQKEENEEFLSRIPKFIEKNNVKSDKVVNLENKNIDNISGVKKNTDNNSIVEDLNVNLSDNSELDQKINKIDENIDQINKEPINLNMLNDNVVPNLNTEQAPEENKIVGMPNLDLQPESLSSVQSIEPSISEIKVPTFEVPAPNIPAEDKQEFDVNNNIPLAENEVNSIIAGINIENQVKDEEISEVIIEKSLEPSKIANSTESKVQTILGVWSKYKIPKTIIKLREKEKIVPLNDILSDKNKDKKDNLSDIQSFLSNAA